jgi:hypothetical protein
MNKLNDLKAKLELAKEQYQEDYIKTNPLLKASTERKIAQLEKEIEDLGGSIEKPKVEEKPSRNKISLMIDKLLSYFKDYGEYNLKYYPGSKNEDAYFLIKGVPAHITISSNGKLTLVEELEDDKLKFYEETDNFEQLLALVNKIYNSRVAVAKKSEKVKTEKTKTEKTKTEKVKTEKPKSEKTQTTGGEFKVGDIVKYFDKKLDKEMQGEIIKTTYNKGDYALVKTKVKDQWVSFNRLKK